MIKVTSEGKQKEKKPAKAGTDSKTSLESPHHLSKAGRRKVTWPSFCHKRLITGSFYFKAFNLFTLFSFGFNKWSYNRFQLMGNIVSFSLQKAKTQPPADSSVTVLPYFKTMQDTQNFWLQVLRKRPLPHSSPLHPPVETLACELLESSSLVCKPRLLKRQHHYTKHICIHWTQP